MQVSLKYAEEHLADLVSAAYRGEEVEIVAHDQSTLVLLQRRTPAPFHRIHPAYWVKVSER